MSSHITLSAASDDRKARLAQLKSLKRKKPEDEIPPPERPSSKRAAAASPPPQQALPYTNKNNEKISEAPAPTAEPTDAYLSGRNYDPVLRAPKLGFEASPLELAGGKPTLEELAANLQDDARRQAAAADDDDDDVGRGSGIDLLKLQPKKPNWDLRRKLDARMEVLNVRTENAIARLVRARLGVAAKNGGFGGDDGEGHDIRDDGPATAAAALDGTELVEGMRLREKEAEEEERREHEDETIP